MSAADILATIEAAGLVVARTKIHALRPMCSAGPVRVHRPALRQCITLIGDHKVMEALHIRIMRGPKIATRAKRATGRPAPPTIPLLSGRYALRSSEPLPWSPCDGRT